MESPELPSEELEILDPSFCARPSPRLARALLGRILVHRSSEGVVAGRIVETEAYQGPKDRAAHTFGGRRTARNEVMWGPPGRAYVYFVYGMHWCLNVVAARAGAPEAVLIRGLELTHGMALARARRGASLAPHVLLRGPGCACRGLGVDREQNGASLTDEDGPLTLRRGRPVPARRVGRSPRIGVAYAGEHAAWPWRFFVLGSASVSGQARLRKN